MAVAAYTLVFQGRILDGFDPETVKAQVGKLFRLNNERLEEMFKLPRVVLKRNLNFNDAARFQDVLHRMGLAVSLEPVPAAESARAAAPAPSAAPVAAPPAAESRARPATHTVNFEFHGRGFEFFKIWIVNILLTILTLGIYSAWAKVRTHRYFYGNTRLDGASFEYLADPIRILKGRVIAFAFFLAYVLSDSFSPILGLVFFALFLILLPWVMVRALTFRNRYSAWRGVHFGFDGKWGESAKAFLLWPALGMLTLGALIPYALYRQQQFIIGNSRYGNAPLQFNASPGAFYRVALIVSGVFIGGFVLAVMFAGIAGIAQEVTFGGIAAMGLTIMATYLVVFALFTVLMVNLRFNHTALAGHRLAANYQLGSYAWLMATNTLGIALTLGLFYPWAKVRTARYAAEHVRVQTAGDLEGFAAAQHEEMSAVGAEVGDFFDVDIGF